MKERGKKLKKTIYKVIIVFMLMLVLFDFIINTNISNAATPKPLISPDFISSVTNMAGGIVSILYWPRRVALTGIAYGIDFLCLELAKTDGTVLDGTANVKYLTPFQIFFNKYKLLDPNVLDLSSVSEENQITFPIRQSVSTWFYIMRLISAIILLAILVYVGIRMALSTIAAEQAKYKKMFVDWVISLILIFVIHYICIFILNINDILVKAIETMSTELVGLDKISDIYNKIALLATLGIGIPSITATIVFCAMVFMTIGFFIAYVNRMIKIAFLVIISPLITITYSIDKMKDQKAQAFETWMKEFTFTVLIQPFHCIMYIAFTNTAYKLLEPFLLDGEGFAENLVDLGATFANTVISGKDFNLLATSVLVIISLIFIKTAEDVVRKIFGFSDTNKSTSFGAGMAMSVMAVSQAKNIGTATRKSINTAKNFIPNLTQKAIPHDLNMLKNTKVGQFVTNNAPKIGNAIENSAPMKALDNTLTKVSNSGAAKTAGKIGGAAGKTISGFSKGLRGAVYVGAKPLKAWAKHNSVASIVGSMYGISQLVAGNNVLEVYADTKAVEEGVSAFRGNREDKLANYGEKAASEIDKEEYNQKVAAYKKQGNDINKDPFEEALDELKQKMPEISSEADFRKKVVNDRVAYNQSYSERASDLRAQAQALKNEGTAAFNAENNNRLDEIKKLEDEAEKLEELAKVESLMNEKDSIDSFWDIDAITERMLNRSIPPSSSDFKKARKELKEELLKILSQIKENNEGDGFVGKGESDSVEAMESSIEEIIKTSVGSGKKVNMDKILENVLSVTKQDNPSEYASLIKKTDNIRRLYLEQRVADSYNYLGKVNDDNGEFSEERLSKAYARKIRDSVLAGDLGRRITGKKRQIK